MVMNKKFWKGKKVFLTGHTGFKGSWLALMLADAGAEVHGFALPPDKSPNMFESAAVVKGLASSTFGDIRDMALLKQTIDSINPQIVLHLAAQPLVRLSYREPVETYATNVMGTVHVLEAARKQGKFWPALEALLAEGLGQAFVAYMATWPGFVEG